VEVEAVWSGYSCPLVMTNVDVFAAAAHASKTVKDVSGHGVRISGD
jgi:hypothetical protein